jgi:uncharacterized protein YutE (UPF0331/DUF86 family)/predicted nucleotidyltransferase
MLSDDMLSRVRNVLNGVKSVAFACLFGSLVTGGKSHHDIDIAVKVLGKDKYKVLCSLVKELSKSLGVKEEMIDLVDLDRADLELKKEIIVHGIILLDHIDYEKTLVNEINAKYIEYDEIQKANIGEWVKSDDPSNVNVSIVKRRIDFAKNELQFIRKYVLSKSVDEVENSQVLKRLLERSFHLILESILDVCRHIVSVMGWGPVLSYSDVIEECFKHGIISEDLKEKILAYIRLRNIIIHRYLEVDYKELYMETKELKKILTLFEKQVLNFIKSND